MRIIGLDLGNKTLGIAMSDSLGLIAQGLETLRFEEGNFQIALDYLKHFVDNNKVDLIVLGLPKNMDGSIGFQGQIVQEFQANLQKIVVAPIHLWDERLTSKMANQVLLQADVSRKKRREHVDKVAATVILQSYLDSRK